MEYFRAPAYCPRSRVMTDPGGIMCLCSKSLDLHTAWQQAVPGADSQCVHCRRCYDSHGRLISALRPQGGRPLPRGPHMFVASAEPAGRGGAVLQPPALAPAAMPVDTLAALLDTDCHSLRER